MDDLYKHRGMSLEDIHRVPGYENFEFVDDSQDADDFSLMQEDLESRHT